jgi:osmotically-inducible protein OsmY
MARHGGKDHQQQFFHTEEVIMKHTKSIVAVLFAASFALAGCATGPKSETAGQYVGDSAITAKVKAKLIEDPALKARDINVETYKGTVQLSGFVSSKEEASRAAAVARDINGVTSVKNDIRLK